VGIFRAHKEVDFKTKCRGLGWDGGIMSVQGKDQGIKMEKS